MRIKVYYVKETDSLLVLHNKRIVGNFEQVILRDAKFRVDQEIREKSLGRDEPMMHAWVEGIPVMKWDVSTKIQLGVISYIPQRKGNFYDINTLEEVETAPFAVIKRHRVYTYRKVDK